MTPELVARLAGSDGAAALAEAAALLSSPAAGSPSSPGHGSPLAAASALRARGVEPDLAAAALTQATLRVHARAKFGPDAEAMLFTRPGLEQATRSEVARRRARRFTEAGVRLLADLGCGIGTDAIAAAREGIRVRAVEADPLTAAVAEANVRALGLADLVTVERADARTVDLSTVDGVFCDPARRRGGTRVFDPRAYEPPWEFVAGLAARVPRTALKLAPGVDHALIPDGAEAEWVSVDGDLVEAAFWCGPLAGVPRRATLLSAASSLSLSGDGLSEAPVGPVGRYLYDPDPAVVRAHLVAELAADLDGSLADPRIAYVYADAATPTAFARCFEVTESMPFSLKRLRAVLRERGVGRLTVKKRGSPLTPEELRSRLRLAGSAEATIVLTRVADAPTVLFVTPIQT